MWQRGSQAEPEWLQEELSSNGSFLGPWDGLSDYLIRSKSPVGKHPILMHHLITEGERDAKESNLRGGTLKASLLEWRTHFRAQLLVQWGRTERASLANTWTSCVLHVHGLLCLDHLRRISDSYSKLSLWWNWLLFSTPSFQSSRGTVR